MVEPRTPGPTTKARSAASWLWISPPLRRRLVLGRAGRAATATSNPPASMVWAPAGAMQERAPCGLSEGHVHKAVRGVGFVLVVDVVMGRRGAGDDIGLGRSCETERRCGQAAGDQRGESQLRHFDSFHSCCVRPVL